jgi:hypothetical protein
MLTDSATPFGEPQYSTNLDKDEINQLSRNSYKQKLGILQSAVSVPLNGQHRTFGSLEVINKVDTHGKPLEGKLGTFSAEDVRWLSIIGMSLSTSISGLRRKNELDILAEISRLLVNPKAEGETQPIYELTARKLVGELTNYKVAILRIGTSAETVEVVAKAGHDVSWDMRLVSIPHL